MRLPHTTAKMPKSYFAPDDFEITAERLRWAVTTFNISEDEVYRQTELWHEHEYKRAYSDWNRAWKRWFRMADKYDTLKRKHSYRRPEELSPEQKREDAEKAEADFRRLRAVK